MPVELIAIVVLAVVIAAVLLAVRVGLEFDLRTGRLLAVHPGLTPGTTR